MRRWFPVLVVPLALLVAACGSDPTPTPRPQSSSSGTSGAPGQAVGSGGSSTAPSSTERMVVRNAELDLAFDDVPTAAERIEDIAEAHGGRVHSSLITGDGMSARGTMTLRVPSAAFGRVVDEIKGTARRVDSEESSSEDVTDEYVDLDAQVRNLQATEAQLQALMERAETIAEVMRVQAELTTVRDRIERLQGKMELLSRTASESVITVNLRPALVERPIVDDSWSAARTLRDATRVLVVTLQVAADVATWVLVLAPVWLPVGVLVYVARRRGWFAPEKRSPAHASPTASPGES